MSSKAACSRRSFLFCGNILIKAQAHIPLKKYKLSLVARSGHPPKALPSAPFSKGDFLHVEVP